MKKLLVIGCLALFAAGNAGTASAQASQPNVRAQASTATDPIKRAWFEHAISDILTGPPADASKPAQGRSVSPKTFKSR